MALLKKISRTIALLLGSAFMAAIIILFALTGYMFVTIEGGHWLNDWIGGTMMALSFLFFTLTLVIVHETS